ncbi:condensation domain-containing protein, partial [Dictyobacter arantiisoli]|uniref:condensation domain-containing protein n=1 Tax=Dictyobacter arantiisoli TaxID=2014874 RepID=UPI0011EC5400
MSDLAKRLAALSPEKRNALLRRLQQNQVDDTSTKQTILPRQQEGNTFPLSFAQERLWFLDQLEPQNTAYNIVSALRLTGQFSLMALEDSLSTLVQRHETLRTSFTQQQHTPVQIVAEPQPVHISLIDLQYYEHFRQESLSRALVQQELQHPFYLETGPLWQAHVLRLTRYEHILLFTMHHIITDGWSNEIMINELTTLYRASITGRPSTLAPLPLQYADYAIWQRQWLQGEVMETQLAYWRNQLAASSPLELSTDHPRPAMRTYRGASQTLQLSPEVSKGLQTLSRQQNVTLFMLLLATFQVLLMRYSGQDDISVGTPIANRQHAEIEGVMGFFVNTLVMRADLSDNPTFVQFLQHVRKVCLEAYSHQDLPFERVVEALETVRDLSRSPLFQVMFVLQSTHPITVDLTDVQIQPLKIESAVSKFDLTLTVAETEQGLAGTLEYSTELFEAETIHRLLGHWKTVLEAVLQHPQTPICALPLLTTNEYALMLNQWNATQHADPQPLCLHQRIEQQVQQTPDAIALVFEEQLLTYAELNRRANQLAHHLQQQGIGPEAVVSVCLERCPDMVIALLAILKTGGTYLPMDPAYPVQRLQYLIHDAALSLVLSHASLQDRLPAATSRLLLLDRAAARWRQEADDNLTTAIPLDQLAYIMYTSGSTGQPKGVMISHRGLSHYVAWSRQHYAQQQAIDSVVHTSVGFDLTVTSLFVPLVTGGKVRLLPEAPGIDA